MNTCIGIFIFKFHDYSFIFWMHAIVSGALVVFELLITLFLSPFVMIEDINVKL